MSTDDKQALLSPFKTSLNLLTLLIKQCCCPLQKVHRSQGWFAVSPSVRNVLYDHRLTRHLTAWARLPNRSWIQVKKECCIGEQKKFTSIMHFVSMTQIRWEKELLNLLLKLSSHKTVTLKNNIDSAACTNWKHPLGEQQRGLSYDFLVSFIQEASISGCIIQPSENSRRNNIFLLSTLVSYRTLE